MQVTLCKDPFEYIIIDDTYTEEELKLIFLELDFWGISGNLMSPEFTGTAKSETGFKKLNKGIFLDEAYTSRRFSNILKLNRKIYSISIEEPSLLLGYIKKSNGDSTLLSYYENKNFYGSHRDDAIVTILTYLYKQPKAFEGGNLIFPEYGYEFEPWFNRTYIIPGVVQHEVTEIIMNQEDCKKGLGRYCISNFIFFRD